MSQLVPCFSTAVSLLFFVLCSFPTFQIKLHPWALFIQDVCGSPVVIQSHALLISCQRESDENLWTLIFSLILIFFLFLSGFCCHSPNDASSFVSSPAYYLHYCSISPSVLFFFIFFTPVTLMLFSYFFFNAISTFSYILSSFLTDSCQHAASLATTRTHTQASPVKIAWVHSAQRIHRHHPWKLCVFSTLTSVQHLFQFH